MNTEKRLFKGKLKQYSLLIALVIIIAFFQIVTGGLLLKPMNVSNVVFQNAYVVILAIGMLLCILTGGNIDLSVGSVVALVSAAAGQMIIVWKWNVYFSIGICLLLGIMVGIWQGFWIAYVRIPAFIVTLSGQLVFRGCTLLLLNGMTLAPFPNDYLMFSTGFIAKEAKVDILGMNMNIVCLITGIVIALVFCILQIVNNATRRRKGYEAESSLSLAVKLVLISAVLIWFFALLAQYQGIPTVLVILGVLLVVYTFITTKTVAGRHLYALGGNEKAARLSGVKTNRLFFLAYVNMGFLAAVTGLVFAARLNSASPVAGGNFELDAIGACFIGGASAYGGVGTIGGTLIGALIMGMLNNGMSILGISSNTQQVVKGLVLLGAVAFDVISKMNLSLFTKRKKVILATDKN